MLRIAHIRQMIEAGLSDHEIEEHLADAIADADFYEAAYGSDDFHYPVMPHLYCDARYQRNDAGEYVNLM